jgi:hypothetical protein
MSGQIDLSASIAGVIRDRNKQSWRTARLDKRQTEADVPTENPADESPQTLEDALMAEESNTKMLREVARLNKSRAQLTFAEFAATREVWPCFEFKLEKIRGVDIGCYVWTVGGRRMVLSGVWREFTERMIEGQPIVTYAETKSKAKELAEEGIAFMAMECRKLIFDVDLVKQESTMQQGLQIEHGHARDFPSRRIRG